MPAKCLTICNMSHKMSYKFFSQHVLQNVQQNVPQNIQQNILKNNPQIVLQNISIFENRTAKLILTKNPQKLESKKFTKIIQENVSQTS